MTSAEPPRSCYFAPCPGTMRVDRVAADGTSREWLCNTGDIVHRVVEPVKPPATVRP